MAKKDLQGILRICLTLLSRRKTAGFTLIELLVSVIVSFLVISGLLFLVVELLNTDKKSAALAQTQQDMTMALDYIASDLEEGIYVYEGECLNGRGSPGDANYCPGLRNVIPFPAGVTPILAFWKLDEVPYSTKSEDQIPDSCSGSKEATCNALKIIRNTYTLVVYSLRTDNTGETWEGPARISRFQLRQYSNLKAMQETQGWKNPADSDTSFQFWPRTKDGQTTVSSTPVYNEDVLVDLVDYGTDPDTSWQLCPTDYSRTPPDALNTANNTSFYACVKKLTGSQGIQGQDVIVYLRGNAIKRAGQIGRNPAYLPKLQAQVKTRTVLNYIPPDLTNN
ncbi:MAG: prepilin-type N-terminal cleavage/methylation domain-containing protein [Oscillatoria sp. Prado101]|jgi:type II secretory pathway pseudopilin PulG|nr:prepilin-type N-terminal cleavage/methylation domain-containing protein [Oscillatoria sp. Prado101]